MESFDDVDNGVADNVAQQPTHRRPSPFIIDEEPSRSFARRPSPVAIDFDLGAQDVPMQEISGIHASDVSPKEYSSLDYRRHPSPVTFTEFPIAGLVDTEAVPPRRPSPFDIDDFQPPDAETSLRQDDGIALRKLVASPELGSHVLGPGEDCLQARTKWAKEIWAARYMGNFDNQEDALELNMLPTTLRDEVAHRSIPYEEMSFRRYEHLIRKVMGEQRARTNIDFKKSVEEMEIILSHEEKARRYDDIHPGGVWEELYPSAMGIGPLIMMTTQSTHPSVPNTLLSCPLPGLKRRPSNSLINLPKSETEEEAIDNTRSKIQNVRERIKKNLSHTQTHYNLHTIIEAARVYRTRREGKTTPLDDDTPSEPLRIYHTM